MAVVKEIKLPRWRVRVSIAVLWVLAPVLSVERGARLSDALASWTVKGATGK